MSDSDGETKAHNSIHTVKNTRGIFVFSLRRKLKIAPSHKKSNWQSKIEKALLNVDFMAA